MTFPPIARPMKTKPHRSLSNSARKFILSDDIVVESESDGVVGNTSTSVPLRSRHISCADSIPNLSRHGSRVQMISSDNADPCTQKTAKSMKGLSGTELGQNTPVKGSKTKKNIQIRTRDKFLKFESVVRDKSFNHNGGLSDTQPGQAYDNDVDRVDSEAEMDRDSDVSIETRLTLSPQSSAQSNKTGSVPNPLVREIQSQKACPSPSTGFKPLPGYEPTQPTTSPAILPLLSPSALFGKELWHFSIPKSLPISAVKDIGLRTLSKGSKAFSYCNSDYKFVEESRLQKVQMHVFSSKPGEANFDPLGMKITRSFLASRHTNTLTSTAGEVARKVQSSPHGPPPKTRPQQPQGLKARYHPIGCGNDNLNEGTCADDETNNPRFKGLKRDGTNELASKRRGTVDDVTVHMPEGSSKAAGITDGLSAVEGRKKKRRIDANECIKG